MSDSDKQTIIGLYEILIVMKLKKVDKIFQILELSRYLYSKFAN